MLTDGLWLACRSTRNDCLVNSLCFVFGVGASLCVFPLPRSMIEPCIHMVFCAAINFRGCFRSALPTPKQVSFPVQCSRLTVTSASDRASRASVVQNGVFRIPNLDVGDYVVGCAWQLLAPRLGVTYYRLRLA